MLKHLRIGIFLLLNLISARASFDGGSSYSRLLQKNSNPQGWVNVDLLKKELPALEAELSRFQLLTSSEYSRFSREERIAYFINFANLIAVIECLSKSGELSLCKPDEKKKWKMAGEELSLEKVKRQVFRFELKSPESYFMLGCFSKACPRFLGEAFQGTQLDRQFQKGFSGLFLNPDSARLELGRMRLFLTSRFKKHAKDIDGLVEDKGYKPFISRYWPGSKEEKDAIKDPRSVITYPFIE